MAQNNIDTDFHFRLFNSSHSTDPFVENSDSSNDIPITRYSSTSSLDDHCHDYYVIVVKFRKVS